MENKELKERFIDEKTGIEYVRQGDYYIPNLVFPKQRKIHLNKYGRMRLNYLNEWDKTTSRGDYIARINICLKLWNFNGKILNFVI